MTTTTTARLFTVSRAEPEDRSAAEDGPALWSRYAIVTVLAKSRATALRVDARFSNEPPLPSRARRLREISVKMRLEGARTLLHDIDRFTRLSRLPVAQH